MKLNEFLDSTYLKTPGQSGLSPKEARQKVEMLVKQAIEYRFKLVMIRPEFVKLARNIIDTASSKVAVGTVIGFHQGTQSTEDKLKEAEKAINEGADELDFVSNYRAFKRGNLSQVKQEIYQGTKLCLENDKIVKWIIEIAALKDSEIASITSLIRDVIVSNFDDDQAKKVFVKSSTGFFSVEDGKPSGATFEGIKIMKENAGLLPIKAAGGVRTIEDAKKMIALGVSRIGTSSALSLISAAKNAKEY